MKTLKYTGYFVAALALNQIVVITPGIGPNLYYFIIGIAIIIGIYYQKTFSVDSLMIWFLLAAVISLVINTVPDFFKAPLRLLTFTGVIFLLGPLAFSSGLNAMRWFIFRGLNNMVFFLGATSFVLYLFGISVGRSTGGFSGFFNHSMMMGPIAGIALIIGAYRVFLIKRFRVGNTFKKKWINLSAMAILFVVLLLSSSRAAILGTISGILFFFYKIYQHRFSGFLSVLFIMTMILLVSYPLWSDFTRGIEKKQTKVEQSGDLLVARRDHWNARIAEFYSSPVFGIGFATVAADNDRRDVNRKTGVIEPGTSWLAILSMVGIFGFLPIFWIFSRNLHYLVRNKVYPLESAFLGGLLLFFITHMFAEGYIVSSGSFLFFYVWLLLGVIELFRRNQLLMVSESYSGQE